MITIPLKASHPDKFKYSNTFSISGYDCRLRFERFWFQIHNEYKICFLCLFIIFVYKFSNIIIFKCLFPTCQWGEMGKKYVKFSVAQKEIS